MAHSNHSILWHCHLMASIWSFICYDLKIQPWINILESRLFSLHLFRCFNMQKQMGSMNYCFIILNHSFQRLKVTAIYVAGEHDLVGSHGWLSHWQFSRHYIKFFHSFFLLSNEALRFSFHLLSQQKIHFTCQGSLRNF